MEIIENVYLASYPEAKEFIPKLKNPFVINCTKDLPNVIPNNKCIHYRIPINDHGEIEDTFYLKSVLDFVVKLIDDYPGPVVVHCKQGRQRSAAVVAGYLVHKRGLTFSEAVKFIQSIKRDAFFPQVNFDLS